MTNSSSSFLGKTVSVLLSLVLAVAILSYCSKILIPITFAALLSTLLYPLSSFLERHGWPRFISIFVSVILTAIGLLGIMAFLGIQFTQFMQDFPSVEARTGEYFTNLQHAVRKSFGIRYED